MPYLLPRSINESDEIALVLAFGQLSLLEACSKLGKGILKAETPCERVGALRVKPPQPALRELAGIHKLAPIAAVSHGTDGVKPFMEWLSLHLEAVSNFSLSSYDLPTDVHEDLVRAMLDEFRERGFSKVHLIRSKGNELMVEEVLSREALDVIAFPFHQGIGIGPTAWVPDLVPLRARGLFKPAPHPEISMSPRLAGLLVNLAGLSPGMTLLDPFCGTGTILAEGRLRSLHCLGLDKSSARVKDARMNMQWAEPRGRAPRYDIRKGDATDLPKLLKGSKVDAVVTEPLLLPRFTSRPRTAAATEMLEEAGEVYSAALASITEVLAPGGRVVMIVPMVRTAEDDEVSITLEGHGLGLKQYQPGPIGFRYPVRPSFESTRWVRRAVYVFETGS